MFSFSFSALFYIFPLCAIMPMKERIY